ncbi:MAG TPA: hypothetical protein VNU71_06445 [Burkholderiaceae bacterium]|nr:hypothetical protein [Burkholderiaceae bacterium]
MMHTSSPQPAGRTIARPGPDPVFGGAVDRDQWVAACSTRLASLRPRASWASCLALAQQMWADVGCFDPEIAAEMEHESCFDDA